MAEESQGFLGRWARRKTEVLQGKPLEEPAVVAKPVPATATGLVAASSSGPAEAASAVVPSPATDAAPAPEKALSLEDVKLLTQDSDFKPFMAQGVGPEVRNAAMKKLFADPHYNVMDGLDIYIDDYSKSDPIPESMLRKMVGAKLLKIFDDEEDEKDKDGAGIQGDSAFVPVDNPNNHTPETVAQSDDSPDTGSLNPVSPELSSQPAPSHGSGASQHDHANPHLRLQPDHAPPAPDAGRGSS